MTRSRHCAVALGLRNIRLVSVLDGLELGPKGSIVGYLALIMTKRLTASWKCHVGGRMDVLSAISLRAGLLRLGAAALGFQIVAAVAQSLPSINVETSCRASAKAVTEALGHTGGATVENCMDQENTARAQIVKNWDTFAPAEKTQCINSKVYMPSYVEWLSCLESRRHLRTLPKQ